MTALRQLLTLIAALTALCVGQAQAADSITINYSALDNLPPKSAAKTAAVPKLIPPSLVRKHMAAVQPTGPENAPAVADNDSVPPVFDRSNTLYNSVEGLNAGGFGQVAARAARTPAVGPAPAVTRAASLAAHTRRPVPTMNDAVPGVPPGEQKFAMLTPAPAVTPGPSNSLVPAASAKAPRFTDRDPPLPPLVSWEGAKNVGEVIFPSDAGAALIDLDQAMLAKLDAVAKHINAKGAHVMLEAFGGARGDKSHEAHRIALRRGLAVRRYLIARGVPSNRIDILAVGGANAGPLNRVDVMAASS